VQFGDDAHLRAAGAARGRGRDVDGEQLAQRTGQGVAVEPSLVVFAGHGSPSGLAVMVSRGWLVL
jgi:hypothetical protein